MRKNEWEWRNAGAAADHSRSRFQLGSEADDTCGGIVDEASYDTQYFVENFEKVLEELKRAQALVLPLAEVWQMCSRSPVGSNGESQACVLDPPDASPALPASPRSQAP